MCDRLLNWRNLALIAAVGLCLAAAIGGLIGSRARRASGSSHSVPSVGQPVTAASNFAPRVLARGRQGTVWTSKDGHIQVRLNAWEKSAANPKVARSRPDVRAYLLLCNATLSYRGPGTLVVLPEKFLLNGSDHRSYLGGSSLIPQFQRYVGVARQAREIGGQLTRGESTTGDVLFFVEKDATPKALSYGDFH